MKNSYKYFANKDCEYYPCHNFENINCVFCFCPLYLYDCGGKYKILDNGRKDCSGCETPHKENGYDYIIEFLENTAPSFKKGDKK